LLKALQAYDSNKESAGKIQKKILPMNRNCLGIFVFIGQQHLAANTPLVEQSQTAPAL
jgi:hypothetical protein